MNVVDIEHPTGAILSAYGLGQLNEEELAGIDEHLAACAACRQVVQGVAPDTFLMLLRSAATEPDSSAGVKPEDVAGAEVNFAGVAGAEVLRSPGGVSGALRGFGVPQPRPRLVEPPALTDHPRYRIGELLGVGGMGAVYRAEHLLMQRPVAVKVLNHELIDNPATIERFRREVRAAARLTHPNIVAAFDAEQAGDVHFLAMEYVEGVSLARRCAEYGPLPVAEACSYARQAALGLQHAHECGMVHRDIKPQNLMLTPGGQVKILDFGLARFVMESAPAGALLPAEGDPAQTAGLDSKAKPLTQIGVVMGTPDYIAPEQAQDSHQADIRADIYSLGCTLYDMLAGHAPFPDGNAVQKIKAHLHKTPPPLKTLRRDVPLELVRVIERMMAKDPAQRYQTPAEAAAALAPFASSVPPRRKKWPLLVTALGFVAALVMGAVIYVQTDRGTIVIETNDDKIAVMIEKAGGVKIVDQANKREYLLKPGAQDLPSGVYLIEVTEPLGGLDFDAKKFELKRGKEVRLTAKFEAAAKGAKPATALTAPDKKRANERLESLKEIAGLNEIMYGQGKLVFDQVLAARRDVAKAELDLCESDAERVKIYEKIVAFAQELVKFRDAQYQAAQISKVVALKAKADLLGALDDLDRAKARATTRDTVLPKQVSGDQGPLFGGKPASFWLQQLKDTNPQFRVEAVGALGMIAQENKELIPVLVAALKDKTQGVGAKASRALGSLGPEAVPVLVEFLKDKTLTSAFSHAADALGQIGPKAKPAVPLLAEALKIEDWDLRRSAITALGRIGSDAKPAIPTIIDVFGIYLKSRKITDTQKEDGTFPPQNSFPDILVAALVNIDPEIRPLVPEFSIRTGVFMVELGERTAVWHKTYDNLKKRYPKQTGTSGQAGTADADLKQELARFEGTWTLVKQQIRWETTSPGTKHIISGTTMTIVEGNDVDAMHRTAEVEFMRYDRNSDGFLDQEEMPPQLKGELGKWDTNRDNLISLDEYKLYHAARVQSRRAKEHIIAVLTFKIDPSKTPKTIDLYRPATGDKEASTGLGIYELTGDTLKICVGIGPGTPRPTTFADTEKNLSIVFLKKGEPAQPAVGSSKPDQGPLFGGKPASFWLEQLKDANPNFRVEAVKALGNIAQKNNDMIPPLVGALKDREGSVARTASLALGHLGAEAVPGLLQVLKDKTSPNALRYAADAVGGIGPEAKAAVPLLADALKMDKGVVRRSAVIALSRIGPDAKSAIPAMVAVLGDYLESLKFPKSEPGQSSPSDQSKTAFDVFISKGTFLAVLSEALSKIDPEIRDLLPKNGEWTVVRDPQVMTARWQQAYDALKKKYPTRKLTPPPGE